MIKESLIPQNSKATHGLRPSQTSLTIIALAVGLGLIGLVVLQSPQRKAELIQSTADLSAPTAGQMYAGTGTVTAPINSPNNDRAAPDTQRPPPSQQSDLAREFTQTVESAYAVDLVSRLSAMCASYANGGADPIRLEDIERILSLLASEGPAAIATIQRFLDGFEDIPFDQVSGEVPADYATLRLALIDTLAEIGGPEAEQALFEALQSSASPAEIALLAQILEEWSPGRYRESIQTAVRETLTMVSTGELGQEVSDVSQLFSTLQDYAGSEAASSLELASGKWTDYAMVALANLPEGQGVSSLIRKAQNPGAAHSRQGDLALEMVARLANSSPDAKDALLALTREDRIPEQLWPNVAKILAGDLQAQIEAPDLDNPNAQTGSLLTSNPYSSYTVTDQLTGQVQVIYLVNRSAVLPQDEMEERLGLIETLQKETENPAAIEALEDVSVKLY